MRPALALLGLFWWTAGCAGAPESPVSTAHALRLKPGEDLRGAIQAYVDAAGIEAGAVVACAGSLTAWTLRFADRTEPAHGEGHFEILALSGTVSRYGSHLHLGLADADGRALGGHLVEGCTVYTTAEVVILELPDLRFTRAVDGTTPWPELQIERRRRAAAPQEVAAQRGEHQRDSQP